MPQFGRLGGRLFQASGGGLYWEGFGDEGLENVRLHLGFFVFGGVTTFCGFTPSLPSQNSCASVLISECPETASRSVASHFRTQPKQGSTSPQAESDSKFEGSSDVRDKKLAKVMGCTAPDGHWKSLGVTRAGSNPADHETLVVVAERLRRETRIDLFLPPIPFCSCSIKNLFVQHSHG